MNQFPSQGQTGSASNVPANPLGTLPINQLLARFAIPSIIAMLVSALYNIVDQFFIGRSVGMLGNAATNVAFPLTITCTALSLMFGIGGAANFNLSMGHGEREDAARYAGNAVFMLFFTGLILCLGVRLFLKPLMIAFGATAEVLDYSLVYTGITSLGFPFLILTTGGSNLIRADGSPRFSMVCTLTGALINTILDPLFIFTFHMGMAGAALATISSQLFSAILVILCLTRTQDMYKVEWRKIRIDSRMLQRIIRIGIPAGMQSVMYNISNIIIQAGVNNLGTDNVTAWATYGKVDGLYWMMINALGISVTTFVGQNYGARRMDRVRKGAGACMVIGVVLTAIVSTALYFWGYLFIELFTSDPQVQLISQSLIRFMVPTFITYITIEILSGTLRGVGDAWMPLIITGVGVCLVRVIWIIFALPHFNTILAAAFCYPMTWALTSAAFAVYYYFFSSLKSVNLKKIFLRHQYK